jgi:hypothetical protein
MEQAAIEGLVVYIGSLQSKDCIMAFGYPSDRLVLLAFAGKDDKEKIKNVIKSMVGAAKTR